MNSVSTVTRPPQLAGQLALVTGASRGIGKAVAQALLGERGLEACEEQRGAAGFGQEVVRARFDAVHLMVEAGRAAIIEIREYPLTSVNLTSITANGE